MTGRYPTKEEFNSLYTDLQSRAVLSKDDIAFITTLSRGYHPMTMLSMTLMHLQLYSKFFIAYQSGVNKSKYWEHYLDDTMDVIAKLPLICAIIYRHKYHNSQLIPANPN